jgi:Tol biopolymer transport system component
MDTNGNILKEYSFTQRMSESMKSPAWSPDGRQIAFSADTEDGARTIFILSLDNGTLFHFPPADNARMETPIWLP